MRHAVAVAFGVVVTSGAALPNLTLAQSTPMVRTIAKHVQMPAFGTDTYNFSCPAGSIPTGYSFTTRNPNQDSWTELDRSLMDRNSTKIPRNSLASLSQLDGGGLTVTLYNINCHAQDFEAFITCASTGLSTDNTLVMAKATAPLARSATASATAYCPADSPVALGGFSNADGTVLQDVASAPAWGTSASPISLADVADGMTGPPTGWQSKVTNTGSAASTVTSFAVCGKAPTLQTFVSSVPVPEIAFGIKPLYMYAPVPDGWVGVASGFDGGQYGHYQALDMWLDDGNVVSMNVWYQSTIGKGYDSGSANVRAYMIAGYGNAPVGVSEKARMAVLAIPGTGPAPTTATIVEFYHSQLDHYFITASTQEISDLDTGVHKGWARTGQSFKTYAVGSAGRTGRRPVCRAYGLPSAGLDTHFYSAGTDECTDTMVKFGDAWLRPGQFGFEASEVFQADIPDRVTGACPANGVPIYRVFNNRTDVNHRYTTSTAIRDQMVAKGGIAEGYGPNAVALCGLQ